MLTTSTVRIVTYRSIFFCFQVISSCTLVVRKQRNTLRFVTIEVENRLKSFDVWEDGVIIIDLRFHRIKK